MKRNVISVIIAAAVFSINAFIIWPLIRLLSSDVLYANTWPLLLTEYMIEIFEVVAVSVIYALMIVSIYEGEKESRVFVIFGALSAYRNLANVLVLWIEAKSVPKLWVWDVVNVLYYTALELVLLLIIFLISRRAINSHNDKRLIAQRVFESTGESVPVEAAYPFKRIYDKNNCLLRSVGVCAVVTFAAKTFGQVANDIWFIIADGLPSQATTWRDMILNYISKAIFGAVVFFAVRIALTVMLKDKSEK